MDYALESRTQDYIHRLIKRHHLSGTFIEIGCGDGFNLEKFQSWGLVGEGIDISASAIAAAKKRNLSRVSLKQADIMTEPFSGAPLVFLLNCLEHIKEDELLISRISSAMSAGQYLFLALPSDVSKYDYADILAGHYRRYSRSHLTGLLHRNKFEIVDWRSVGFPVCNFYTWVYNRLNSWFSPTPEFDANSSHQSGITSEYANYPWFFRLIAPMVYPILRWLMIMDFPFSRTQLGNSHLIMAKKT